MRSVAMTFLAGTCFFLASGEVRAQGNAAAAKSQALTVSGNQALAQKNYPLAISYYQQAIRTFPANAQASLLLQQTMQAYQLAQNAYTTNLNAGRVALGKSDFQTATTAFTAAATALPADKTAVATAQKYITGAAAIQAALTEISNGDFTDAKTNYNTAYRLIGSDQYAKTPLAQISLAIAQNADPAKYYTSNFNAGVTAMVDGQYPQAQKYFKTAAGLPAGMNDQNKAQNYYNAAVALQTAYTDLSPKVLNYSDAVTQYQTVVTSLASQTAGQVVVTRLNTALANALNTEIAKGNQYLNANDLDNAFLVMNNVTQLATIFPKSTAAQAYLTRFQNQATVTLTQALANGTINPTTFAVTGSSASTINVSLQSTKVYIWYLKIPAGTIFNAQNIGINNVGTQNMVVLADTSFQVKPNVNTQFQVGAVSMDPSNSIPTIQNQLVLSNVVPSKSLLAVLKAVQAAQPGARVAQFAVWIAVNPALNATDIAIGSVGPTAQEIATLQAIFRNAGLNPQGFQALQ